MRRGFSRYWVKAALLPVLVLGLLCPLPVEAESSQLFIVESHTHFSLITLDFEHDSVIGQIVQPAVVVTPAPIVEVPKPIVTALKKVVSMPVRVSNPTVTLLYADAASRYGSCVPWAKAETGINHSIGNGARSGIQGKQPRIGAIGSLRGTPHAVVVTAINGTMISFKESGFERGWITSRTLPLSNFLGFVYF